MRRLIIFLLPILLYGFERQRIAIFSIKPVNVKEEVATAFLMALSSALTNSDRIINIERSEIEKLFKEQAIQLSGCTSTECTVEMGRMLGAEKIVLGSISEVEGKYLVSVRLVDVELGSIIFEMGPVKAESEEKFPEVAEGIVREIEKRIPVTPEIVGFLGEDPVLDVGSRFGIAPGDEFNVVRITGVVRNKEGRVIFRKEEVIGRIRVKTVQEEGAVCEVLEKKKEFAEGDLVKKGGKGEAPPVVEHVPVKRGIAGKPFRVCARVYDDGKVEGVYVLIKERQRTLRVEMEKKEDEYCGLIPERYTKTSVLYYAIKALDDAGNVVYHPERGKFYEVKLSGKKRNLWLYAGGAGLLAGGGILIYMLLSGGELPGLPPRPE
ncbi:hypothetical protein DRQ18_05360 [bacterium]|nr:MAG: hypothetical protein DRQ18_05360 [bacterium]